MNSDIAAELFELSLLSSASYYDLSDRESRLRSVRDLEGLFLRMCRAARPTLFIEAGAKDAATSRRARRYLPNARIIAYEANPHTYGRFGGRTLVPARTKPVAQRISPTIIGSAIDHGSGRTRLPVRC